MLIPVHKMPGRTNKTRARVRAPVVAHAVVDEDMAHLAVEFWSISGDGYAKTYHKGKLLFMHHAVVGRKPGRDVSHENADKLDNRRRNLRHASRSDNVLNPHDQRRRSRLSCPYRGVTRDDQRRKLTRPWRGKVVLDGRTHQTQRFATPEEAAIALNALRASLDLRVQEFPTPTREEE